MPRAKKETAAQETAAVQEASIKQTKSTTKAAKPAAKKLEPQVFVQYEGFEWNTAEVLEKVQSAYVAEGHRASSIKSLSLYFKPEEHKAYYVINDSVAGCIEL